MLKELKKAGGYFERVFEPNGNLQSLLDKQANVKRDPNVHEY